MAVARSALRTLVSAVRIMILEAFAKKKVAVLIAVKNICEPLSTLWVSDLRPQYALVAVLITVKNICENLSTVLVSDLRPQYAPRNWRF